MVWEPPLLGECRIDRKSATPFHRQIQQDLERKIRDGVLRPYDKLPTVQELAKAFRVGPGTIVRALSAMAHDEVVVSRQGSGTYVAPLRAPTTALLHPFGERPADDPFSQFGLQILDGLRRAYGPEREIHVFGSTCDQPLEEIWKICRIKNSDGLIFHALPSGMLTAMAELSRRMPVAGLLQDLSDGEEAGAIDRFLSDPGPVMETLLRERVRAGQKRFAYLGLAGDLARRRETSRDPYAAIHTALCRTVGEAGLVVEEHALAQESYDAWYHGEADVAGLPRFAERTTLVTTTPGMAQMARALQPGASLDAISYCTGHYTLRRYGPGMTILYLGIDILAEEAARHIQKRNASVSSRGGEQFYLSPEVRIVERGG